jgi:hypothetical protein
MLLLTGDGTMSGELICYVYTKFIISGKLRVCLLSNIAKFYSCQFFYILMFVLSGYYYDMRSSYNTGKLAAREIGGTFQFQTLNIKRRALKNLSNRSACTQFISVLQSV